ncbi:MAG TPA: aryl-sulfate sulfotransferase [Flavilitoribacter sp.]|nr:aryl-sulfate sulfotransferase [Flavilitoribacter sp.]
MIRRFLFLILILWACLASGQQTVGLFTNNWLAVNGYTLWSNSRITYLIDNCGYVVNTWTSDYPTNTAVYLLENGNLLRTAEISGNFNVGGASGRLELFNWDGDLVWSYNYAGDDFHLHHDIEPLPNGHILLIAWERKSMEAAIAAGRAPDRVAGGGLWPEKIVEIEMVGTNQINTVWEWHLWDHLIQDADPAKANYGDISAHPELVDLNAPNEVTGSTNVDWVHLNAIDYNPVLDQIAVSSRHLHEVWIIDHSTTTAEAAGHSGGNSGKGGDLLYRWGNPAVYHRGTTGDQTLYGPHNVTWILEEAHPQYGKLMVFNNGLGRPGGNFSSVDIWTPPVAESGVYNLEPNQRFGLDTVDWAYTAPGFYSANISGAQALAEGNILICSGKQGHFFEITGSRQIVWDYINPVSGNSPVKQGQTPYQNDTFRATRYREDYPAFTGRDLTPGDPVELSPWPYSCTLYPGGPVGTGRDPKALEGVSLAGNPFGDQLQIENMTGQSLQMAIFDATGRLVYPETTIDNLTAVDTADWPAGLYIVRVFNRARDRAFIQKAIKIN